MDSGISYREVVSHLVWVLGFELRSSAKVLCTLNHQAWLHYLLIFEIGSHSVALLVLQLAL